MIVSSPTGGGFGVRLAATAMAVSIDQAEPLLVVDNQKTMVELTRRVLSRLGFENIDDASDGYQALTLLREKKHKLVISDLRMAAMGGIQLLKTVRADDQLKNTPFILMTGSLDVPNVLAARYAGTDAYSSSRSLRSS